MASKTTRYNPLAKYGVSHVNTIVHLELYSYSPSAEGSIYTGHILSRKDLDRQLVKSESCTITIPELELTIPAHRGQLTTVEGLLRDVIADLGSDQPLRRVENEAAYNKIQSIIDSVKEILADDEDEDDDTDAVGEVKPRKAAEKDAPMKPFTIRLDDPAGNSFLEFIGSMSDPKWNMRTYRRTRQQNIDLGLINPDDEAEAEGEATGGGLEGENEEIFIFPGSCSSCGHKSDTLVKKVNIPYFKVRTRRVLKSVRKLNAYPRTFSSCPSIVTNVDIETTRSSRVLQSRSEVEKSLLGLKTEKTSVETSLR